MLQILRTLPILLFAPLAGQAQLTLVDSIPFPGSHPDFWCLHVTPDTIFLGANGDGAIHFSDHNGNISGVLDLPYNYCQGLIPTGSSYIIAEDYAGSGAMIHELDLAGQLITEWQLPTGVFGNSSGIGDLELAPDGAIWLTVYHPDGDNYPFAYAYKWTPSTTFIDTVPLNGAQPYGIAIHGDTLLYVIDDLDDDIERIYAYDLTNEEDLFYIDLPDTPIDNDQRPFGMHYFNGRLYLIADRQGGSAFAYQTIFIYEFDANVGMPGSLEIRSVQLYPNPASNSINITIPVSMLKNDVELELIDQKGRLLRTLPMRSEQMPIDVSDLPNGSYTVRVKENGAVSFNKKMVIAR